MLKILWKLRIIKKIRIIHWGRTKVWICKSPSFLKREKLWQSCTFWKKYREWAVTKSAKNKFPNPNPNWLQQLVWIRRKNNSWQLSSLKSSWSTTVTPIPALFTGWMHGDLRVLKPSKKPLLLKKNRKDNSVTAYRENFATLNTDEKK